MRTLRLLFWLRWRIALNTTSKRGRWAVVAITTLFALALSPIYVGGAIGAHALAAREGAPALLVVFGICQFGIMWMSLLTGAMGRTFELDKLKRYPLRSRDVFAINTIASLTEPIVVMTMPSLLAAAFGVARHSGAGAGFAALTAGALLLLVTGAILQLLLALLDDLLRREWMRYVAAFFFTFTILGVQVALRGSSAQLAKQVKQAGFTPDKLIAAAEETFGRIPTMAAPASVAGAHPAGFLHSPLAGLAATALLIAVPWALGARIMGRAALRAPVGGTLRMRESAGARGSLAPGLPFLSRTQSLLVAREILYMLRTPALLYQLAVVPLSAVALLFLASSRSSAVGPFLPLFVVVGTLAGRNLMLWGFDGPGIRTLFLLPVSARELVLTKNIGWFLSALLEMIVILGLMVAMRPAQALPHLPLLATGWLALALVAMVAGTWVSVQHPMRPPERGLARRNPGGAVGLGAVLGVFVVTGALVLIVIAVRALTPDPYDELASVVTTSILACAAAGVWWIGVERNADSLERGREKMIDMLAKSVDA